MEGPNDKHVMPGKLEADNMPIDPPAINPAFDDPFEWTVRKKWTVTIALALLTLTSTTCSSIFSSAIVVGAREFDTSETVMLLGVSLFVVGYALGPLFWGPVSEAVGRRKPVFCGFVVLALMQIPIALSKSLTGILIARFIAGCGGAAPVAVVSASYADIWRPAERGTALAVYSAAAYAGPTLGPIIGSFVTESHLGWRWTSWLILIVAAVTGISAFFLAPETYGPVLRERADRAAQDDGTGSRPRKNPFDGFVKKFLSRPVRMLLQEPMLDVMTVYISVTYGIMYLTFFAWPYAFEERGWKREVAALSFLSILVGVLTSCFACWQYSIRYYAPRLKARRGQVVPEDRLPPVMLGAILLPLGLFWFAWTSSPGISWIPQMLSGFFVGCGIMLIFTNGITFLVDAYLQCAASAMAANTFVRSLAAAGLPLAAPTMYRSLGTAWATSVLAFMTVALIPAPFMFYKYGEALRKRSKFSAAGNNS